MFIGQKLRHVLYSEMSKISARLLFCRNESQFVLMLMGQKLKHAFLFLSPCLKFFLHYALASNFSCHWALVCVKWDKITVCVALTSLGIWTLSSVAKLIVTERLFIQKFLKSVKSASLLAQTLGAIEKFKACPDVGSVNLTSGLLVFHVQVQAVWLSEILTLVIVCYLCGLYEV